MALARAIHDVESPIELPSDAESEVILPSDASTAQEAEEEKEEKVSLCCTAGCMNAIAESTALRARIAEIHASLENGTKPQAELLQFNCLKAWAFESDAKAGWRKFKFCGLPLCVDAVVHVLNMTKYKYSSLQKQIAQGRLGPDQSLRNTQKQREKKGEEKANTLLQWLHQNVAESLVGSKRTGDNPRADALTFMHRGAAAAGLKKDSLPTPLSHIQFLDYLDESSEAVRWLPPGTSVAEMKDLAQTFLPDSAVSYSTFFLRYQTHWAHRLKIRSEGQHAKCAVCARLKEFRRQCAAASDVSQAQAEFSAHIAAVMADRRKDAEPNTQAQLSVGPEMMMLGAIVEGLTEHYVFADQDMVKDSNLQCTIIGMVLEASLQSLQARGQPMPRHLRIHTDNASGEGKNQYVFYLAAWMARRKLFDSVTLSQFRVGHSHGKPDQRFSEVRWALSQCSLLEVPEHFADAIRTAVKPREGRDLLVHKVGASLDFKSFFNHLRLNTSGHTQTKAKTKAHVEAVHVFSFSFRHALPKESQDAIQELSDKRDLSLAPRPDDVILSCKHHLASGDGSQPPFVFAAATDFERLPDPSSITVTPRAIFSDKQIKEFEKTAWKICQAPWTMHQASGYLLKLVTENKENGGDEWFAPGMTHMLTGKQPTSFASGGEPPAAFSEETFAFNRTTPGAVHVQRAVPTSRLRRKGAALWQNGAEAAPASSSARPAAPASMYGRDGAPERVAAERPGKQARLARPAASMKRPAARAAPTLPEPPPSLPVSEAPSSPQHGAEDGAGSSSPAAAVMRRPAAAAKATASKAAPKRRQLGRLPMPASVTLGCSRRRYSQIGCAQCRRAAGLVLNPAGSAQARKKSVAVQPLVTWTSAPPLRQRGAVFYIEIEDDQGQEDEDHFMEFFSPPRVAVSLRRMGFRAHFSFDLLTGYDFLTFHDRARALRVYEARKPSFLMLSPPCTMYSKMQILNLNKMNPEVRRQRFQDAHCLLDFAMLLAMKQHRRNRKFCHEHPSGASSWQRPCVLELSSAPGVHLVTFDQCRVGLRTPAGDKPLRKRTTLMTNSLEIQRIFAPLQCNCTEEHGVIQGSQLGFQVSAWCQRALTLTV
eukprot:s119_g63.t1